MTTDRDQGRAIPDAAAGATNDPPASKACLRPAGAAKGWVDSEARRRIGRDLRLLYASVVAQPLPERFTKLVDELTAATVNREGSR